MSDVLKTVFSERSARLTLVGRVSSDMMKLFVDVERPPATRMTLRRDLLEMLEKHIAIKEVNLDVIDDIVRLLNMGELKVERRRIAVGCPAEPGVDGKLLLLKKKYSSQAEISMDSNGKADYRHLHLFDNIRAGDIIARVYPPKEGVDGRDVFGKRTQSKPGKPYRVMLDKTLRLEDSPKSEEKYQVVVSCAEGYLVEDNSHLSIKPDLVIRANLDLHVGSLDFIGRIEIRGDVMPGLDVKAKTGILIQGGVNEASLICSDGDIIVKGCVLGGRGSRITCGKSFSAKAVDRVDAEVLGNIQIQKEARDSVLRTHTALLLPQGTLMGGEAFAVGGVEVNTLGNAAGVRTVVHMCNDAEATIEYGRMMVDLKNHEQALHLLRLHLGPYADNSSRLQLLKDSFRTKMEKFLVKFREIEKGKVLLLDKQKELLETAHINETLRLNVLSRMFEGVIVKAGEAEYSPEDTLNGPVSLDYCAADNKITAGPLKPLEMHMEAFHGTQGENNERQK